MDSVSIHSALHAVRYALPWGTLVMMTNDHCFPTPFQFGLSLLNAMSSLTTSRSRPLYIALAKLAVGLNLAYAVVLVMALTFGIEQKHGLSRWLLTYRRASAMIGHGADAIQFGAWYAVLSLSASAFLFCWRGLGLVSRWRRRRLLLLLLYVCCRW